MAKNSELFNGEEVLKKIEEIKTTLDEFSKTIQEVNELVDDTIQNGETSAVNGSLGSRLYRTWEENKTNVKDFQDNFENWIAVVSLISATNQQFIVDAAKVYTDNKMDLPSATRNAISSGKMTMEERFASTSFGTWKSYEEAAAAGYSNIRTSREFARGGSDLEKYKTYDNYLKAMYDKYTS